MNEPKWTPGPWTVHSEDLRGGKYWVITIPGAETIDLRDDENGEANAWLIAAASALYAALFRETGWFDPVKSRHGPDCGCGGCEAFRALAAARGEPEGNR